MPKIDLEMVLQNFLETENLVGKKILLSVSGGVDSMVLLEVASKICDKKNLAVFHFNHNFREKSDDDQNFVQNICSKKGICFFTEKLKKTINKNKENLWREARKVEVKKIVKKFGAKKVLTGHNATDLVETIIFRITKGTGIKGLSPFDVSSKPFWEIPKAEIISFAKKRNVKWREDESNQDLKFERNLIRHKVLPSLRKITPNLENVFIKNSQNFDDISEFLNLEIDKINDKKLSLKDFQNFPKAIKTAWLKKIGGNISFDEISDCLKWLRNPQGNSRKKIGKTELTVIKKEIIIK